MPSSLADVCVCIQSLLMLLMLIELDRANWSLISFNQKWRKTRRFCCSPWLYKWIKFALCNDLICSRKRHRQALVLIVLVKRLATFESTSPPPATAAAAAAAAASNHKQSKSSTSNQTGFSNVTLKKSIFSVYFDIGWCFFAVCVAFFLSRFFFVFFFLNYRLCFSALTINFGYS